MTEYFKDLFLDHAIKQAPREACGLLIVENGRKSLVFCANIAEKAHQFIIDPMDFVKAESRGEIIAVIHSHPMGSSIPSEADKVGCEQSGLKWIIVGVQNGDWTSFEPSGYEAPLMGREWSHGVLDCYSLVRDYYKKILKIEIPDYDRNFEWWVNGQDLFDENFRAAGFFEVPQREIKKHDGIMMQINSPVTNHAGVFLGGDKFIHHCHKRLSSKDLYNGLWFNKTVRVVRHRSLR